MILRYSAQDYTTSSGRDVTDAHLTLTLDLPDPISDYLVQNPKYPNEIQVGGGSPEPFTFAVTDGEEHVVTSSTPGELFQFNAVMTDNGRSIVPLDGWSWDVMSGNNLLTSESAGQHDYFGQTLDRTLSLASEAYNTDTPGAWT
jgi:hypothetical protein